MTDLGHPLLAPGTVVVLAGPDVPYRVGSLSTSGADATLHLRTVDGRPWVEDRPEPLRVTGWLPETGTVTGTIPAGPIADAVRENTLRGLSLAEPLPARPAVTRSTEVEFVPAEPAVHVRGLPDTAHLPEPVLAALGDLARVCRDVYGMGVEVDADDDRVEVRAALDLLRRRLDP